MSLGRVPDDDSVVTAPVGETPAVRQPAVPQTAVPQTAVPHPAGPQNAFAVPTVSELPASEPPVRATWTVNMPDVPWCPVEWREMLRGIAPGLPIPAQEANGGAAAANAIAGVASELHTAGWAIALASRRGRLHAHRGEYREDAAAALVCAGGWCAAVADGAGSAEYSRIGAALAVHVITGTFASTPLSTGMSSALTAAADQANAALREFASQAGLALRALRTTLLFVALRETELGILHVGDGGIVLLAPDGSARLPTAGHAGEFSGEVSHFLPDDGAVEQLRASMHVASAAHVAAVVMATDGVEDPWYPMGRTAPSMFTQLANGVTDATAAAAGVTQPMRGPVLQAPDPAAALAEWLTFEKRGENDDRTLLVAHRPGVSWPLP